MLKKSAQYSIRILPEDSIMVDEKMPNVTGNAWKIEGFSFPDIPLKLPLRAKAACFAKKETINTSYSPTYTFLYANEEGVYCLALFRYMILRQNGTVEYVPIICRCVGKRFIKKHWKFIVTRILNNYKHILAIEKEKYIDFNVY